MASTLDVFVVTQSYRRALQLLTPQGQGQGEGQGQGFLVITGPPRAGKSSLAHALLQHYADLGHTPLIIKTYQEWRTHVSQSDVNRQVVLLDHVLGREGLCHGQLHLWKDAFHAARAAGVSEACPVVITVNDHVLAEVRAALPDDDVLQTVVDLSAAQPFTGEEKREMLQRHLHRKGKSLQQQEVEEILQNDASGVFFPSLCSRYVNIVDTDPRPSELFTDHGTLARRCYRHVSAPLHHACRKGDRATVSALLEEGVSCDSKDEEGNTPLHLASGGGHADVLRLLLTRTMKDVDVKNIHGQSPLILACQSGQGCAVSLLLQHGATVQAEVGHESPLHVACKAGHVEVVRLLLDHKADVDHEDCAEQTSLHRALEDRSECKEHVRHDIVRLLLQGGADLQHSDRYGTTPLDLALTYCHNECVQKTVLLHMAENNIRTVRGATAMHLACQHCSDGVLRFLQRRDFPGIHLNGRDSDGATPLLTAIRSRNVFRTKIISFLLDKGSNVYTEDYRGACPLEEYVTLESELLHKFVECGADLTRRDSRGNSLLHLAITRGMDKYGLYQLVANGLSIHSKNHNGDTPLHVACTVGHAEAVRMLLDGGSCADAENQAGESPVDIAFENSEVCLHILSLHGQVNDQGHYSDGNWRNKVPVGASGPGKTVATVRPLPQSCKLQEQAAIQKGTSQCDTFTQQLTHRPQNTQDAMVGTSRLSGEGGEDMVTQNRQVRKPAPERHYNDTHGGDGTISEEADYHRLLEGQKRAKLNANINPKPAKNVLLHDMITIPELSTVHLQAHNQPKLHAACLMGATTTVERLLREHADANQQDDKGKTALHCASSQGGLIIADLLLQHGYRVNAADTLGQRPLHLASGGGHASVAALLLSSGAERDARDVRGNTALHIACARGFTSTASVLISGGADANLQNTNGDTALHLAARERHVEVAVLALRAGSRVLVRNGQKRTALAVAVLSQHKAMLDVMERHASSARDSGRRCAGVCWQQPFSLLLCLFSGVLLVLAWVCYSL